MKPAALAILALLFGAPILLVAGPGWASVDASSSGGSETSSGESLEVAAEVPRLFHVPVHALRRVAEGVDRLEIVTDPLVRKKSRRLLAVADSKEIAELMALIDTPPVEDGSSTGHGCGGFPRIRLFRKSKMVAEFSFDHVSMLRPWSDNLWSGGDVDVTRESARAMAAWFDRRGFHVYQEDLDELDREAAREKAFFKTFPPAIEALLKNANEGEPAGDALAVAVPNELERARMICRALGSLDSDWFQVGGKEKLVLHWAEHLSSQSIAAAIDSCPQDSAELRGAARLLFGWRPGPTPRLGGVDVATRDRVIARAAALIFEGGPSGNQRILPLRIMHLTLPGVEEVLQRQSTRVLKAWNDPCGALEDEEPSLSVLAILAERQKADPRLVAWANKRSWKCPANGAAAHIAAALAMGRPPRAVDLRRAAQTTALVALKHFRNHPTRAHIDLAFASLLPHLYGVVRGDTGEWLAGLAGLHFPDGQPEQDSRVELERWWKGARPDWQDREQANPSPTKKP